MPPPRNESPWVATAPGTEYPPFAGGDPVDVAVLGGGITGLTTALLLAQAGARVAVVERHRIAGGTTGNTTAKVTSQHGLAYAELIDSLGVERARQYADGNEAAIQQVATFVEEHSIDCDFRRLPAVTYTEEQAHVSDIEKEVEAARRLGLPVSLTTDTDLPYPVRAGVRFDNQARLHPRKYCQALAERVQAAGGAVYEHTGATAVDEGEPCRVQTDGGTLEARQVVVATLVPFLSRGQFTARTEVSRSYALGARVGTGPSLDAMYISVDVPIRSVRSHPVGGEPLLIVSGEAHKTGHDDDTTERYAALEEWARERFDVDAVEYRWAAQDYIAHDHVPYAGPITSRSKRVFVGTGFRKWGLTNGTAAAMIVAGLVRGEPPSWAPVFDSTRLNPRQSAPSFVRAGADFAARFVGDRVGRRSGPDAVAALAPGEAAVARIDGHAVAASRDEDGVIQAVSAVCTHQGCLVRWNTAERSWDCPCHGSRFAPDGTVLEGPATGPLQQRAVDVPD